MEINDILIDDISRMVDLSKPRTKNVAGDDDDDEKIFRKRWSFSPEQQQQSFSPRGKVWSSLRGSLRSLFSSSLLSNNSSFDSTTMTTPQGQRRRLFGKIRKPRGFAWFNNKRDSQSSSVKARRNSAPIEHTESIRTSDLL